MSQLTVGSYALATDLKGFPVSTLRVRVERIEAAIGLVMVRTASLVDAGTLLVLEASQVTPILIHEIVPVHPEALAFDAVVSCPPFASPAGEG
jgi:hypothetical protein